MSVSATPESTGKTDTDLMRVRVVTEDATGTRREYTVGIAPNQTIDGAYVMHGRRVDSDAPDEAAGGGVSSKAWDAAAEQFKRNDFEIFGH
jgi:hypothetical protein